MNLETAAAIKNASALWNFYSSPVNILILIKAHSGYVAPPLKVVGTQQASTSDLGYFNVIISYIWPAYLSTNVPPQQKI